MLLISVALLYVFRGYGEHTHFDEWTGPKLYPALALAHGADLYQTSEGPFLLTIYGPGSPIFYLPAALGSDPESCMWIACILNYLVLFAAACAIFLSEREKALPFFACTAMAWLFLMANDKTTNTLYFIHHDLPALAYLFAGSLFLLRRNQDTRKRDVFVGSTFIWLAVWTKIVALPWLLLPLLSVFSSRRSFLHSIKLPVLAVGVTGIALFALFSWLFGAKDIWFHTLSTTNSYSWRECQTLFGEQKEPLVGNGFSDRLIALLRLTVQYSSQYWTILLGCGFLLLSGLTKKGDRICFWLSAIYFLALPTCLCALAKFGGVANSLVFAHAPAYAALLRKAILLASSLFPSPLLPPATIAFAIISALPTLRTASGASRDTSQSPLQLAYLHLTQEDTTPIYFALAPIPNLLATGEVHDSGEALTFATMTNHEALPPEAGTQSPLNIPTIAFGPTGYSITFFSRKFDLTPTPSPPLLKNWTLYQATPKTVRTPTSFAKPPHSL